MVINIVINIYNIYNIKHIQHTIFTHHKTEMKVMEI